MIIPESTVAIDYFEWMKGLIDQEKRLTDHYDIPSTYTSYDYLLEKLHSIKFRYIHKRDRNRAEDGIDMRYRFAVSHPEIRNAEDYLVGPCSVFEMMVALAVRCEESIMDDTEYGDRTSQWFWGMVVSLGLGPMTDIRFDERLVEDIVERFLDLDYEPDGSGGLFRIRNCDTDLREVEIWYQMCRYLDSIT